MKSAKICFEMNKKGKELVNKAFKDLESFVSSKIEIEKHLTFIEDYLIKTELKETDLLINISVNTVSLSLTLFIAFVSVPTLNGDNRYPLAVFVISVIALIILIIYRRYKVVKLIPPFLKNKIKFIRLLQKSEKLMNNLKNGLNV